jgi:hypothetical protein
LRQPFTVLLGLRLHLVCTVHGLPIAFALTGAKADERETLLGMFEVEPGLGSNHLGKASGEWDPEGSDYLC